MRQLRQDGLPLAAFVRPTSNKQALAAQGVELREGDLGDGQSLRAALAGIHTLVNVASLGFGHAPDIVRAAVEAGVQRAVFVSTTSIYTRLPAPTLPVRLEAERLIRTEQGVGSFVRAFHPNAIPFYFTDKPASAGARQGQIRYQVIAQEVVPAPMDIAERLRLAPGTPIIHVARRHLLGDQVLAHTVRYLPEHIYPSLMQEDLTTSSVHLLLVKNSELPLLRAEIEVEAHLLTAEEAALLDAAAGTSALVISRLTYTAPNLPAVWYRGLFRETYHMGVRVGDVEQTHLND